jgi:hypothetical protein
MKYQHAEAFRLMKYLTKTGEFEIIWNSRDGVTPFCITSRSGDEATHVEDMLAPDYDPSVGERIFVDLTEERAKEIATKRVELFWDHPECPARERWATKEEAVAALLPGIFNNGRQPNLVVVTKQVLQELKGRA